jgi:hypothetical protein
VRDGTWRGKFLRPVPCTHLVSKGVFECTPRNPLQQLTLLWHSSDDRGFRLSPLGSGAQSRPAIEQVGSVINRSAAGLAPFLSFFVPGLFFGRARIPHRVGMGLGLAWGWHVVGMWLAWGRMGLACWHGVSMGLAWGWHGVSMGLAWGWHGVSMGLAWG